jgi:hypothetical protein
MEYATLSPDHAALLDEVFGHLAAGAANPESPFRNLTFATGAGAHAAPSLRTMVLRRFAIEVPALEFHTDCRSPKLRALPSEAGAHVWDPATRLQFRIKGYATLANDAETDEIWRTLPATTRNTYAVNTAPGTPIHRPEDAARMLGPAEARANFRVIRLRIAELECLHLAPNLHRRARFTFASTGAQATWLVP